MPLSFNVLRRGRRRPSVAVALALALLAAGAMAGLALAKSATLRVAKNVHVTNAALAAFRAKAVDTHEAVAVGPTGFAVYAFQGETTHHIICKKTNSMSTNCWGFWPPVEVKSAQGLSKQVGIKGKLGAFPNHGKLQLTLNGQPVYYFTPDIMSKNKKKASGDELKTFGSIWHIIKAAGPAHPAPATMTQTSTTPTTPYPTYP